MSLRLEVGQRVQKILDGGFPEDTWPKTGDKGTIVAVPREDEFPGLITIRWDTSSEMGWNTDEWCRNWFLEPRSVLAIIDNESTEDWSELELQ